VSTRGKACKRWTRQAWLTKCRLNFPAQDLDAKNEDNVWPLTSEITLPCS